MTSTSGTWTNPISGVTSPSTSGFIFETALTSTTYTDIRTTPPTWAATSGLSGTNYVAVRIPVLANRGMFGGGYNYLKVEFTVSGQNKAITYFVFNTYSTTLPSGQDCIMLLSCGSGRINTTNTSTPTVINCNVVEVS